MPSVLDAPTLKLNKSWLPIDSTTVREAIKDVMGTENSPPARIVEPVSYGVHDIWEWMNLEVEKDEPCIHLAHGKTMKVPEVIIECNFNRNPVREIVFCRRNIWKRDNYACQYCGKRPPTDEVSLDHIMPKSRGGISSFKNCVLACMKCNKRKNNRTPKEANMRLVRTVVQNGKLVTIGYDTPAIPSWSPLYALRRRAYPASWRNFLNRKDVDMLYWETEIEP